MVEMEIMLAAEHLQLLGVVEVAPPQTFFIE
jgi:hypothetical protein